MARRYDLAIGEPVAEQLSAGVQRIVQGYTFDEPAIELGVLMENDAPEDAPDDVLAQLGSRVQHQLRAIGVDGEVRAGA